MRTLVADDKGNDGLKSWDLSVFRFPRSEKWKKAIANDKVTTLELEFSTVEGKSNDVPLHRGGNGIATANTNKL